MRIILVIVLIHGKTLPIEELIQNILPSLICFQALCKTLPIEELIQTIIINQKPKIKIAIVRHYLLRN